MALRRKYRVLYLPYCYAMDHQAAVAIRRYVEQGGTIWADAMIGWKDQYGRIAAKAPGELSDVFGFQLHDVKPEDQPFALSAKGDQAGERWRVRLTVQDADVLLRASDGEPIATRKNFGRGEAYYYATALSLGYFKHADPTAHRWISDAACRASAELPVQLASALRSRCVARHDSVRKTDCRSDQLGRGRRRDGVVRRPVRPRHRHCIARSRSQPQTTATNQRRWPPCGWKRIPSQYFWPSDFVHHERDRHHDSQTLEDQAGKQRNKVMHRIDFCVRLDNARGLFVWRRVGRNHTARGRCAGTGRESSFSRPFA